MPALHYTACHVIQIIWEYENDMVGKRYLVIKLTTMAAVSHLSWQYQTNILNALLPLQIQPHFFDWQNVLKTKVVQKTDPYGAFFTVGQEDYSIQSLWLLFRYGISWDQRVWIWTQTETQLEDSYKIDRLLVAEHELFLNLTLTSLIWNLGPALGLMLSVWMSTAFRSLPRCTFILQNHIDSSSTVQIDPPDHDCTTLSVIIISAFSHCVWCHSTMW